MEWGLGLDQSDSEQGQVEALLNASKVKVKLFRYRPMGIRKVKSPDFLDVRHYEGGKSLALRTSRLYTRSILVLIFRG